MHRRNIIVGGAVALACAASVAPVALAHGPSKAVTVRVEGVSKTLLAADSVVPKKITVSGHSCAADSAAAALSAATDGRWSGSWSASLADFDVTKILGETDNYTTTKSYWAIFVAGDYASRGLCGQTVKPGTELLLAAVGNTESPGLPIDIVKATTRGGKVTATVDYYTAAGKLKPLKGATVKLGGKSATTNAKGVATLTVTKTTGTLTASETGYIRDELALKV